MHREIAQANGGGGVGLEERGVAEQDGYDNGDAYGEEPVARCCLAMGLESASEGVGFG